MLVRELGLNRKCAAPKENGSDGLQEKGFIISFQPTNPVVF